MRQGFELQSLMKSRMFTDFLGRLRGFWGVLVVFLTTARMAADRCASGLDFEGQDTIEYLYKLKQSLGFSYIFTHGRFDRPRCLARASRKCNPT